jgi:hypothetical protein
MEYEIYYLSNLLGVIVIILIILFHFIDADAENCRTYEKELNEKNNEGEVNNYEEKNVKTKKDKKKVK